MGMNYTFEDEQEMEGILQTLDNKGTVEAFFLKLDMQSTKKLEAILRSGKVTCENQKLLFKTVMVKKEQLETFLKGQNNMTDDGNRCTISTVPWSPIHFKGNLQMPVKASDGMEHLCSAEIGSIEFDLFHKTPEINGESAIFSDISATVYPTGTYRAVVEG